MFGAGGGAGALGGDGDPGGAGPRAVRVVKVRTELRTVPRRQPPHLVAIRRNRYELADDESGLRRLNEGQRAIYAMYVADFEILNGGFSQFWFNSSGGIANDLLPAAELVGSPEFAAIFRDAAALWPGARVPRDRAKRDELLDTLDNAKLAGLDERYAATQYKHKTALANVLAPYIRANTNQFVAD